MKKNQLLCFVLLLATLSTSQAQVSTVAQQQLNQVSKQFFIENKGQWPSEVLYLTQLGGLNTWITTKGMLYEFYKMEEIKNDCTPNCMPNKFEQKEYTRWGQRVAYKLEGNNLNVTKEGHQKQSGYYNYLIGNDASKHASYVGLYKEALVKEVYHGIDMRYYFDKGLLRYDFIVHPGADPKQIKFSYEGSNESFINKEGELVFTTCFGEVKNANLYCYQNENKNQVTAQFISNEGTWQIALGDYNKNETLVIDPLIYSTYLGGNGSESTFSISTDHFGNAYIGGYAGSYLYPTTTGAFQSTNDGYSDVIVTKLNSLGSGLVYSTYIGGTGVEYGYSMTIDNLDKVYITGGTNSGDYNITSGAFQSIFAGSYDIFVTKLNATGTDLEYSTYLGGSEVDYSVAIAVDTFGNAYITGKTESPDFDVTLGAFQAVKAGSVDAFVTKINSLGTGLIFSTYLGGNFPDEALAIAIDATGFSYITGNTAYGDFPVTNGAYKTIYSGGIKDAFVTKLNLTGSGLIYSSYIGGIVTDEAYAITVDATGNAYITGTTGSNDFNITAGAFQTAYNAGGDIFVSKLNTTGSNLIYSTFIGGNDYDYGYSIAVDPFNYAYITGYTNSADFDVTSGAIQTIYGGSRDAFVTKLNPSGGALSYSTYLGGSGGEESYAIAYQNSNNVYVTGITTSADFDTTLNAYQTVISGFQDLFVTKLNLQSASSSSLISKTSSFLISPNPSQGIYQITFDETSTDNMKVEVYDIQGRLVYTQAVGKNKNMTIDISNQASGVYVLKVKAKQKQEVSKIVKL
jgi:Secretion system C-terminal sorting domain/Beta-propeller repeat